MVLPAGAAVRDGAAGSGRRCPTTAPPAGGSPRRRNGGNQVAYRTGGSGTRSRKLKGEGEFSARRRPDHAGDPSRQPSPTAAGCAPRRPSGVDGGGTPSTTCRSRATSRASCRSRCRRSWNPEAVRAQAVAARTYAAYERNAPARGGYQMCDTWSCQVYGGYERRAPRLERGGGRDPVARSCPSAGRRPSPNSASSWGGWTSAGSVSYLPGARGPVRRLVGQPGPRLVAGDRRQRPRADLSRLGDLRKMVVTAGTGTGTGAAGSARSRWWAPSGGWSSPGTGSGPPSGCGRPG